MDSKQAKHALMWYFLIDRYFLSCTTETSMTYGIADILAVKENHQCYEVEIKVSKSDLNLELRTIKEILTDEDSTKYSRWNCPPKYVKHSNYLHKSKGAGVPNRFYFAVPLALKEYALEGIDGTPYGLITLNNNYVHEITKRSKLLHDNKISKETMFNIVRRTCKENMNLMGKAMKEGEILK